MLSIGQLAKRANVSNRTLRYYEELGLIVPKSRGENRYRYYDDSHLQRLNTIKLLQESGFALKEIVAAITPALEPGTEVTLTGQQMAKQIYEALGKQQQKLRDRQIEIAQTVEEIQKMMTAMQECFGCKLSTHLEECAKCPKGPHEVRHLGRDLMDKKFPEINSGSLGNGHASVAVAR